MHTLRLLVLVVISSLAVSCGSAQTPPPTISWNAVASGAVAGLRIALNATAHQFAMNPQLTQAQRDQIAQAARIANDSLNLVSTGLIAYENNTSLPNQCRLHANIDSAITASLDVIRLLQDAGVPVPPELAAAVGVVGAIADALVPGCGTPMSSAPRLSAPAPVSSVERIRLSLTRAPLAAGTVR